MAYSVLLPRGEEDGSFALPKNTLYHLSLDRSFAYVCAERNERACFLSVLSRPLSEARQIRYRQAVLSDFRRNPKLLDAMQSLYARFAELERNQKSIKRDMLHIALNGSNSIYASQNLLQANALCFKRALLFVKALADALTNAEPRSEGLQNLLRALLENIPKEPLREMLRMCTAMENFSIAGNLHLKVALGTDGKISRCHLLEKRYIRFSDLENARKGFSPFRKQSETKYPCEQLFTRTGDRYEPLTASAITEAAASFESLSAQLFNRFLSVGKELAFYRVALSYAETLDKKGVETVFPDFSENGKAAEVCGLRDLFLLLSASDAKSVVPNDARLPNSGGILLFGDNGSGKTVYLRSLGTAQILAQAGLPVPAKSAVVPVFKQFVTQFSEAEKEFRQGNEAGRFEQEVRELAVMAETLKPGALVFLNETFQSTAYAEGAAGLADLLRYFTDSGIRWVLVTHLRQLETAFPSAEAKVLYMGEHHIIVKKENDG